MLPIDNLTSVRNLTAKRHGQCTILIQWEPPFLLSPELSVLYKVYIDGEMIQDDISDTNYAHCFFDKVPYNISIQAYHQLILGDLATTSVNYCGYSYYYGFEQVLEYSKCECTCMLSLCLLVAMYMLYYRIDASGTSLPFSGAPTASITPETPVIPSLATLASIILTTPIISSLTTLASIILTTPIIPSLTTSSVVPSTPSDSSETDVVNIIIGIAVPVIMVILVIVIVLVFLRQPETRYTLYSSHCIIYSCKGR